MSDCTKCKNALWDYEEYKEYYNTHKQWFVDGCKKDADPEDCEEFEEVDNG